MYFNGNAPIVRYRPVGNTKRTSTAVSTYSSASVSQLPWELDAEVACLFWPRSSAPYVIGALQLMYLQF